MDSLADGKTEVWGEKDTLCLVLYSRSSSGRGFEVTKGEK
jgi:hypothetical protein